MGEYEPDDSRNVTQTDKRAPGEPPRTGPREDEARRKAEKKDAPDKGEPIPGSQQQAQQSQGQSQGQSQSQGGQSRSQDRAQPAPTGNPDRQEMQAEPQGSPAGNQPQAIDNPSGASNPQYDQYEVNQPQNMHQQNPDQEDKVRQQAGLQSDGDRGFGYGADGGEEMRDAPDASERTGESHSEDRDPPGAELRGYGGRGEAASQAKD